MSGRFLAVECLADEPLVRERLQLRGNAAWSPSDGRWEVYQAQLQRVPPEPLSDPPNRQLLRIEGLVPLQSDWIPWRVISRASRRR